MNDVARRIEGLHCCDNVRDRAVSKVGVRDSRFEKRVERWLKMLEEDVIAVVVPLINETVTKLLLA
jgi:hypothetical protein